MPAPTPDFGKAFIRRTAAKPTLRRSHTKVVLGDRRHQPRPSQQRAQGGLPSSLSCPCRAICNKSPASQGCSPVPGLSLGLASRGCSWEPPSQVREDTGLQCRVPLTWGHSMSSCNSRLCRAWSRLTTVWWTASSPSMSSSRSSIRMAIRILFWGHRESLPERHACDAGPPTPHTSPEHSLQGAAFQTDPGGWKPWPWLGYSTRHLQGLPRSPPAHSPKAPRG